MKYDPRIVVKWFAEHGIYAVPEYQFFEGRKWRFDFVFCLTHPPKASRKDDVQVCKLALEVQGGLFTNGRHSRGASLLKEHEKLNAAAAMGWRVLYTIPQNLCMPETIELIKQALCLKS